MCRLIGAGVAWRVLRPYFVIYFLQSCFLCAGWLEQWRGVRWGRILWFIFFNPIFCAPPDWSSGVAWCALWSYFVIFVLRVGDCILYPIFCVPPDWSSGVAWCALRPYFVIFVLYDCDRIFFNPIFCVPPDRSRGLAYAGAVFCDFCAPCWRLYSLILFSVCRLIGAVVWPGVRWGRILQFLCSTFETVFSLILFCVCRLIVAVAVDAVFCVSCALRLRQYFL